MAINFPDSPSTNDTYTVNGRTYIWNGEKWLRAQPELTSVVPTLTVSNDFTVGGSTTVGGHIVPDTDVTYDLGSSTYRFRDLYLSGNSIDLGGMVISYDGSSVSMAPSGGSSQVFATEGYVDTAVANLINSAPDALNTLDELAAALGDDANYATTITNALAGKSDTSHTHSYLPLSGGTLTGNLTAVTYYSSSNGAGTNYRLGDDCWIGDVNVANTTRLTGVQNSDRAYLQFGNSGQTLGQVGSGSLDWTGNFYASGWIQAGGNMYLRSGNGVHDSIYRVGGIFFTWDSASYGTNTHHSIRSTNGDSWGDHITINSFGNVRVNIDSNGNGSNTFTIGRHTTGTSNTLLYLDESANLEVYGGRLATSKNSTGNVGNASLNLGLGNGSGVIAAWNAYNYAPLITIGSGEIFYIRNYLNSSYAWLYGYINNVSSKHHKTNIRTLGEPTASVGSAGTTFDAMEKVRQLRPVTYHLYERDALPRMPKNEDGTLNQRRIDAINRLDKVRKKNGLGHFERDDLKHICGRDCEGDIQNPCFHYKNWSKGKIGFIAQEVGEVLNEVADFSEERPDEHESIDSLGLIAICVKALQEIDNRLAQLEAN